MIPLTALQAEILATMYPGEWTLSSDVAARLGRTAREAAYGLKRLVGAGRLEVQVVGAKHNPIYGDLLKRGAEMPRALGFFVYKLPDHPAYAGIKR